MKNILLILLSSFQICLLNLILLKSQQLVQENKENKSKCPCLQSKIRFDDSSIEKIVLHPEEVLANPDAFWASDSAYCLVKQWHKNISFPLPTEQWNKWMKTLKDVPINDRAKNPQLVAARSMVKKEKEFNEKAIPYLCSFLPKDCPQINTTIYFTTAIVASGFQMGNSIVIYGANADKDNIFIHEMFHRGFDQYSHKRLCSDHQDSIISQIYGGLQNEGMATYVGYKGLKDFPHCRTDMLKDDYKLFENNEEMNALLNKMNELFKKALTLGGKELKDALWQVGSIDRAFYVVGCYMAKTIDEKLGRDAFVETISMGPQSFLRTYNSLVDGKLCVFDLFAQK
jgi:hypothetical protein